MKKEQEEAERLQKEEEEKKKQENEEGEQKENEENENEENEKDVLGEYKNDDEEENEEEEEENLFPFKIVGNGKKKGDTLGKYHSRYFEIDTIKGLFKRYTSAKEYPKNPRGIIEIKNFKLIKKEKLTKEYNDLEITYTVTNKKGKTSDKVGWGATKEEVIGSGS